LARIGQPVLLWGRNSAELELMRTARQNSRYLPGVAFPAALALAPDLDAALSQCRDTIVAVPSQAFTSILERVRNALRPDARIAWATKGFAVDSRKLPHQLALEILGERPLAVLSGPTFAKEVGEGLPTALTVASRDANYASDLARLLTSKQFRAYTQPDVMGVEVGGAMKNIIAIGAGIADGMGFGANTRVALITRGLAEMVRLGEGLGAKRETFMGLAGLGDLVLTCTDDQSRNRRFGIALGRGQSTSQALAGIHNVVEGIEASRAVRRVAAQAHLELPICAEVYQVVHEGKAIRAAVESLMNRAVGAELR
jgi:glycerol-3-phosphate dehydrogenase (NAD(P)+)